MMKKLFVTFFIAISLSGLLVPLVSFAQFGSGGWNDPSNMDPVLNSATNYAQRSQLPSTPEGQAAASAAPTANCSVTNIGQCLKDALFNAIDVVGNFFLQIAAWILWACGYAFNLSIVEFIVQMKSHVTSIGAIFTVWQKIRDLANMFFIFILLVIAIQTILGIGKDYKIMLRNVILVALFINFSFFVTGLLIDVSNIIALQFYNGFAKTWTPDEGVSGAVLNSLKIASIYDISKPTVNSKTGSTTISAKTIALNSKDDTGGFLVTVIMGSILMVVLAGVFLASAILVLYRFVTLIFLLMLSSLAFATLAFPALKKYGWNQWWEKLIEQVIFAPVYLMFLWITMSVIASKVVQPDGSFTAGFAGNGVTLFGLIASYVIVISMLIFSLTLARKLGAGGIDMAEKAYKGFTGFVRNNTVGFMGKQTIGRGAAAADKFWGERTGKFMGGTSFLGSRLRGITTSPLAKNKFGGTESFVDYQKADKDRQKLNTEQVRTKANSLIFANGMAALNATLPANASQEQKDEHKEKVSKLVNWAKTAQGKDLSNMKAKDVEALIRKGYLNADKVKTLMDDKNISHSDVEKDSFREAFSAGLAAALAVHAEAEQKHTSSQTPETEKALEKATKELGDAISNLGEKGIELVNPKLINSNSVVQMTSQKQYEKILENSVASDRAVIKTTRLAPITNVFGATVGQPPSDPLKKKAIEHFGRMTGAEIAKLDDKIIENMFNHVEAVEKLSTKKLIDAADANMSVNSMNKIIKAIEDGKVAGNEKAKRLSEWKAGPGLGVI